MKHADQPDASLFLHLSNVQGLGWASARETRSRTLQTTPLLCWVVGGHALGGDCMKNLFKPKCDNRQYKVKTYL